MELPTLPAELEAWAPAVRAVALVLGGLVVIPLVGRIYRKLLAPRMGGAAQLVGRLLQVGLWSLVLVSALVELGFDLKVFLGAAGIATVALGFASQTAASNLISGLFLLGERPFTVGDVIKVDELVGEVVAVDLLAVKLRTFDNLFVRLPSELLMKQRITNLSHYPIRRYDLMLTVGYREDLEHVRQVLEATSEGNPLVLDEPKPLFIFQRMGADGLEIQFSVWAGKATFIEVRNSFPAEVKRAFDAAGIEIPYPQRTLSWGGGEPIPVRLEGREEEPKR